jgi:hypothetical protein
MRRSEFNLPSSRYHAPVASLAASASAPPRQSMPSGIMPLPVGVSVAISEATAIAEDGVAGHERIAPIAGKDVTQIDDRDFHERDRVRRAQCG